MRVESRWALLVCVAVVSSAAAVRAEPATCLSPNPADWPTRAKPYFMVVVDSSGSMITNVGSAPSCAGYASTRMGHAKCALRNLFQSTGGQVNYGLAHGALYMTGCGANCYGNAAGTPNPACGLNCFQAEINTTGACLGCGPMDNAADPATRHGANILVPLQRDDFWLVPQTASNNAALVQQVDNNCTSNLEVASAPADGPQYGVMPINGVLRDMRRYFQTSWVHPDNAAITYNTPLASQDPTCRRVNVILIVDGDETCDNQASAVSAAAALFGGVTVGGNTFQVRTHVINFAGANQVNTDAIAAAGGTGASYFVTNEAQLSAALLSIVTASIPAEACDNLDNDCNGCTDEGFTHYCNTGGGACCPWNTPAQRASCLTNFAASITQANPQGNVALLPCTNVAQAAAPATWLCPNPGDACDNVDNNCANGVDEGQVKCGSPAHCPSAEVCDGEDNNCNGVRDEGCPTLCIPSPEICDGCDNDCNGFADDNPINANLPCGLVGPGEPANCAGTMTCRPPTAVPLGACTPTGGYNACNNNPQTETCDSLDNNCNGVVDDGVAAVACVAAGTPPGIIYGPSTTCVQGMTRCAGGMITCVGFQGPSLELCDGLDTDCNGTVDDVPGVNTACCPANGRCGVGNCTSGRLACGAGGLECVPGIRPTAETCGGGDEDCNGLVDDVIGRGGSCDLGVVDVQGTLDCTVNGLECVAACVVPPPVGSSSSSGGSSSGVVVVSSSSGVGSSSAGGSGGASSAGGTSGTATSTVVASSSTGASSVAGGSSGGGGSSVMAGTSTATSNQGGGSSSAMGGTSQAATSQGGVTSMGTSSSTTVATSQAGGSSSVVLVSSSRAGNSSSTTVLSSSAAMVSSGVATSQPQSSTSRTSSSGRSSSVGVSTGSSGPITTADGGSTPPDEEPSGCSCETSQRGPGTGVACLLFAGLLLGRRRRGARRGMLAAGAVLFTSLLGCSRADLGLGSFSLRQGLDASTLGDCVDGGCGNTQTDPANCGSCGRACVLDHAAAVRCVQGRCQVDTCETGFTNADGLDNNGCELACTVTNGGVEICDTLDNDCNGTPDDGFGLTDVHHCGACGTDCEAANPNVLWACVSGGCVSQGCKDPSRWTIDPQFPCAYACIFVSVDELCNGQDDDCDGQVDEDVLPPLPSAVCGVSPNATAPECTVAVGVACVGGAWSCTFPSGVCGPSCGAAAEVCDTLDNNCDGRLNENVPDYGTSCNSDDGLPLPGDGLCRTTGTRVCSGPNATQCSAVKANCATLPGGCTEVCDGQDNDCDGLVDETFQAKGSNAANFVKPAVTKIAANLWVYSYEASRAGASATSPGTGNGYTCNSSPCPGALPVAPAGVTLDRTRACSMPAKLPWFGVTPVEAEQVCQSMGGRLCTTADWQTACLTNPPSGTNCTYGYNPRGAACTAQYSGTKYCNLGPSYDFSSTAAGDQDGLLVTASPALQNCWADWSGLQSNVASTNKIYDLTGNLGEVTKDTSVVPAAYRVMGGSFRSAAEAAGACNNTSSTLASNFTEPDMGFRCCFTADPTL